MGVCAPSSAVDAGRLAEGARALEALGLRVLLPEGLLERELYNAGPAARRLEELYALFEDEQVQGVLCARGGAGLVHLLPALELERLLAFPKVFLGYSDVTPLHVALNARGLVTFHGPMVATDFPDPGRVHLESFLAAVMRDAPRYQAQLESLRPGEAEAPLVGGCLSMLAALEGTPWALRPEEDVLLFLEDVDEPPYRVDRLLWQLRRAGALERVRGIVFGAMEGCESDSDVAWGLRDVLGRALSGLDLPVAFGLRSGHVSQGNVTLPLGVRARLEAGTEGARLAVLEDATE